MQNATMTMLHGGKAYHRCGEVWMPDSRGRGGFIEARLWPFLLSLMLAHGLPSRRSDTYEQNTSSIASTTGIRLAVAPVTSSTFATAFLSAGLISKMADHKISVEKR